MQPKLKSSKPRRVCPDGFLSIVTAMIFYRATQPSKAATTPSLSLCTHLQSMLILPINIVISIDRRQIWSWGGEPSSFLFESYIENRSGRWSEAEHDATKALEIQPDNHKAFYRRAVARRELGNFGGAREG